MYDQKNRKLLMLKFYSGQHFAINTIQVLSYIQKSYNPYYNDLDIIIIATYLKLKSEITFTKYIAKILVTLLNGVILSMNELVLGKWDS